MNAKSKGTVGVVGLGIMGGAIARNLAAARWRVIGFDIDAARSSEAAAAGVEIASNSGALARAAPVVLTSLPDPGALQAVVGEIITARPERRTVVELSTFALDDKIKA